MRWMQTLTTTTALALAAPAAFAESHAGSDPAAATMDAALCETGYARYDENGDGMLSDRELQDASTAAFRQMDSDSDGVMTESEYVDCVNKMAGTRAMPGDRTEANMGRYDANSDGQLTAREFMNAANSSYDAMQEGRERAEADITRLVFLPVGIGTDYTTTMTREDAAARSALLFVALDTDESGSVDPVEWTEQTPAMKDRSEVLSEAFERADADSSGDIDGDEYHTAQELIRENAEAAASGDDEDASRNEGGMGDTGSDATGEAIEGYEMPMNTLRPDEPAVYFTYDSVM